MRRDQQVTLFRRPADRADFGHLGVRDEEVFDRPIPPPTRSPVPRVLAVPDPSSYRTIEPSLLS